MALSYRIIWPVFRSALAFVSMTATIMTLGFTQPAFGGVDLLLRDVFKVTQDKSNYLAELVVSLNQLPGSDPQEVADPLQVNRLVKFADRTDPTKGFISSTQLENGFLNGFTNGPAADAPNFWVFAVGLEAPDFNTGAGAAYNGIDDLSILLAGTHVEGPRDDDAPNNSLPQVTSRGKDVTKNRPDSVRIKKSKTKVAHPIHGIDKYGVKFGFKVGQDIVDVLNVPDPTKPNFIIVAEHLYSRKKQIRTGMTTGSSMSFAFGHHDDQTGSFTVGFSAEGIDIARRTPPEPTAAGSTSSSSSAVTSEAAEPDPPDLIDPEFANDPVLHKFIDFSPAEYQGFDDELQLHQFGGGTVNIVGFGGNFTFEASFDEMFYDPETDDVSALLADVEYTDTPDDNPSLFLDQFTDTLLFGTGGPGIEGILFTFSVPDMDVLSNNFTTNFFSPEPMTFLMTGSQAHVIPEPATIALLAMAAAGLLHDRRRRHVTGVKVGARVRREAGAEHASTAH